MCCSVHKEPVAWKCGDDVVLLGGSLNRVLVIGINSLFTSDCTIYVLLRCWCAAAVDFGVYCISNCRIVFIPDVGVT